MAKGKKTIIKEIKKLSDKIIMINTNTYVILEDTPDIETAIMMKVTSHGNRILRFKDENKKARIDLVRELIITKYTINDDERALKFKRGYDLTLLEEKDTIEPIATADCYAKSRIILDSYIDKKGENYDKRVGVNTFYVLSEA